MEQKKSSCLSPCIYFYDLEIKIRPRRSSRHFDGITGNMILEGN
jgi:hypothetical protein